MPRIQRPAKSCVTCRFWEPTRTKNGRVNNQAIARCACPPEEATIIVPAAVTKMWNYKDPRAFMRAKPSVWPADADLVGQDCPLWRQVDTNPKIPGPVKE